MFHDPARFAFPPVLEANWQAIREEYRGVREAATDWPERELYGEGWKVYGLFDFPHGRAMADNIRRCPATAALIEQHVPRHGAAGFSVLAPGTRIRPHEGYRGPFLRCHLGLSVPGGDCGLTVGGETRRWQEGRVLVFDDRVPHAAWNLTPATRVVLLIDFVPEAVVTRPAPGR